jgi:hypothetical protein
VSSLGLIRLWRSILPRGETEIQVLDQTLDIGGALNVLLCQIRQCIGLMKLEKRVLGFSAWGDFFLVLTPQDGYEKGRTYRSYPGS